jgi:hypothetical protein
MDGRDHLLRAFATVVSIIFLCFAPDAMAQADAKAPPTDHRVYKSAILEQEFIRACAVVIRIDDTEENQAQLDLIYKNRKKARFYTIASVPLTLKQATSENKSKAEDTQNAGCATYTVTGIPDDMIKSEQTVTLKISEAKGKKEIAELTVCNSGGEVCRRIQLARVTPAGDSVELKPAKETSK